MNYNLITAKPEVGITEDWLWETDLMSCYDGSEDSIPLLRYPKKSFSAVYSFDDKSDLRKIIGSLFSQFQNLVKAPLFQYQTKLKALAASGASSVSVNSFRSDLREGYPALLIDDSTFEELTVDTVTDDTVTFTTTLVNSYSKRAILCPLAQVYLVGGPTISRGVVDSNATATFKFYEYIPIPPFVSPLNTETLTMFDSMPVLEEIPYGNAFDTVLNTGTTVNQFIGIPDLLETWLISKLTFNVTFLCQRVLDITSWYRWVQFAEYCQGSMNPFLLSTNREDLAVVTPAAGSGNQVTVEGDVYSANYWDADAFKRISIQSDAGTHYATVTAIGTVGANDRLTFSPALPAGAGWDSNQKISFLLKVRNSTDRMTCTHQSLVTDINFSIRTVA